MLSFRKNLLSGFVWRLSFYASAFLLNIVVANHFGAGGSGEFYLLLSNLSYIILFFSAGIDGAIGFFSARKEIEPTRLFFFSLLWSLAASIIIAFLYTVFTSTNLLTAQAFPVYIFWFILGNMIANFLSALIFALHKHRAPNVIFTFVNIALLLFLLSYPLWPNALFNTLFLPIYLGSGLLLAVCFIIYLIKIKILPKATLPDLFYQKKFFRFAAQAFIFTMLYALLLRCDYWLVDYFCNSDELGNYIQTTKLNQVVMFVPAIASFSLFPLVVAEVQQKADVEQKILRLINIYFYVSCIICIGLAVVGYWLFPAIYGESFGYMYQLFLLLAPGLIFLACSSPLSTLYSGQNFIRYNISAILVAIVVMVLADIVLIPYLNVYGAAIGSSIAYGTYFFILLYKFRQIHNFPALELVQRNIFLDAISFVGSRKIK